jgi:hypothetical protein
MSGGDDRCTPRIPKRSSHTQAISRVNQINGEHAAVAKAEDQEKSVCDGVV